MSDITEPTKSKTPFTDSFASTPKGLGVGYYQALKEMRKLEAVKIQLEEALKDLLFVQENADETGYVTDASFVDIEAIQTKAHAALKASEELNNE